MFLLMNKIIIVFYALAVFSFAVEVREREVIVLENRLKNELQNYLSTIIPSNAFAISTTIRASGRTIKEYLNSPSETPPQIFQDAAPGDNNIGPLPGLENAPQDLNTQLQNTTVNTGPYTLVKRLEIDAVDVQLTIDNDVPAATQDAIRRAIGSKLNALYEGL